MRVTVYIHHQDGQTYGQVQHRSSADISRTIMTNNSFARAIVKAGKPRVFLTVLIPHPAGRKAADVVKTVRTSVDSQGAAATIGAVKVRITPDGDWSVQR